MEHSMTVREVALLIEWLITNGHTVEDAAKCIAYIAERPAPEK